MCKIVQIAEIGATESKRRLTRQDHGGAFLLPRELRLDIASLALHTVLLCSGNVQLESAINSTILSFSALFEIHRVLQ